MTSRAAAHSSAETVHGATKTGDELVVDDVSAAIRVSVSGPPPGYQQPRGLTRREVLRLVVAGSTGLALALLGVFPPARRAAATDQTPSTTSTGCYGPSRTGHTLAGTTGCCVCGSAVSSSYCGSDNWHAHHPSGLYEYKLRSPVACGGKNASGSWVTKKNAWLWTLASTGRIWRCSDGHRRLCTSPGDCSAWTLTVCPYQLPLV